MSRPSGSLIAGFAAWAGSILAALEYLAGNSWAASADLRGLALWTMPVAALVYVVDLSLEKGGKLRPLWRFGAAALLGPVLGLACFATAATLLGGWKVGFPVYICWAFGAALGLTAGAWAVHPRSWALAAALATAAVLLMLWANASARAAESRSGRRSAEIRSLETFVAKVQRDVHLAKRF